MRERLTEIFSSKSYDFPALLNAITVWLWGVWLLLPFGTYSESPHLTTIESIAPEHIVGIFSFVIGLASAYSILAIKDVGMKWGAAGLFYFWLLISIGAISGNWESPSSIVYPMLALFSAWVWAQSHS